MIRQGAGKLHHGPPRETLFWVSTTVVSYAPDAQTGIGFLKHARVNVLEAAGRRS